jgi:hypothetical protein
VRGSDDAAAKKVEGRDVIGDGAPFDAQPRSLGVQGWSQAAGLNKPEKRASKGNTSAREKLRTPKCLIKEHRILPPAVTN